MVIDCVGNFVIEHVDLKSRGGGSVAAMGSVHRWTSDMAGPLILHVRTLAVRVKKPWMSTFGTRRDSYVNSRLSDWSWRLTRMSRIPFRDVLVAHSVSLDNRPGLRSKGRIGIDPSLSDEPSLRRFKQHAWTFSESFASASLPPTLHWPVH
jgi:hypothetical protein